MRFISKGAVGLSSSDLMNRAGLNGALGIWCSEESRTVKAQHLLCLRRAHFVPVSIALCLVMILPDPNASDLRLIFSLYPLPVTWALLHKLQRGLNKESPLPSFHIHLCHLHAEFSSVTFLLLWEKENKLFGICSVACCTHRAVPALMHCA